MNRQRNPLLNRLQRHNQVATLFRSPDPQAVENNLSASAENRIGGSGKEIPPGTVKAGLVPPGSLLPRGYLLARPIAPQLPVQTEMEAENIQTDQAPEGLPEFSSPAPLSQFTQSPAPKAAGPASAPVLPTPKFSAPASTPPQIQRQVSGEAAVPPAQTPALRPIRPAISQSQPARQVDEPKKEESKFSQSQLDRLQAIFDIHKSTEISPIPSGEDSTSPTTTVPAQSVDLPQPVKAEKTIQRTPVEEPAPSSQLQTGVEASTGTQAEPGKVHLQPSQPPQQTSQVTPRRLPDIAETPKSESRSAEPKLPPLKNSQNTVVQPLEMPNQRNLEGMNQVLPERPVSGSEIKPESAKGTLPSPNSLSTPSASPSSDQIQRLPDQSAEPTAIAAARIEPINPAFGIPSPSSGSQVKETFSDEAETTQMQPLQEVWTVERRPNKTQSRIKQSYTESVPAPVVPPTVHKILQETAPGQPTDSRVETLPPRMPRPEVSTRTAPAPVLQRTPEKADLQPVEMIDSAVGPLPSDLWKLIGAQPPSPLPSTRVQPSLVDTKTMTGADQAAHKYTPIPETSESTQKNNPEIAPFAPPQVSKPQTNKPIGTIQREPETTSNAGSSDSATVQSSEQSGEQTAKPPELDLEDLSIKVYAEVKRRLSVEWERLRSRF